MLSNRLKTVASFITPYKKIADIGCDHGYLIQYAFENLNIENAQAIDNKPGPLESAKKNNIKFKKRIIFSLSSGLDDLNEEIEVIIMAGMGGTLISNLLETGLKNNKLENIKRLILQPNRNSADIRKAMLNSGFNIKYETVVFEDKYYEIIVYERSSDKVNYSSLELNYGPILLKEKPQQFINKINHELAMLQSIDYQTETIKNKIKELENILC